MSKNGGKKGEGKRGKKGKTTSWSNDGGKKGNGGKTSGGKAAGKNGKGAGNSACHNCGKVGHCTQDWWATVRKYIDGHAAGTEGTTCHTDRAFNRGHLRPDGSR